MTAHCKYRGSHFHASSVFASWLLQAGCVILPQTHIHTHTHILLFTLPHTQSVKCQSVCSPNSVRVCVCECACVCIHQSVCLSVCQTVCFCTVPACSSLVCLSSCVTDSDLTAGDRQTAMPLRHYMALRGPGGGGFGGRRWMVGGTHVWVGSPGGQRSWWADWATRG